MLRQLGIRLRNFLGLDEPDMSLFIFVIGWLVLQLGTTYLLIKLRNGLAVLYERAKQFGKIFITH